MTATKEQLKELMDDSLNHAIELANTQKDVQAIQRFSKLKIMNAYDNELSIAERMEVAQYLFKGMFK